MVINSSKGFRDMFRKFTQVLPDLTSFGPWASPYGANGQMTIVLHNYRSRQVHKTLNGVSLSSNFRDMHSARSEPNHLWRSFWPMGKPIWGKWAKFHRFSTGENPSSGYRDMGSTSLAAAHLATRPPAQTVMTIPLQPGGGGGGWGVKLRQLYIKTWMKKINWENLYTHNKLYPWMGTIYPRSDHYPPHPEISNKDFYLAVGTPIFSQIFSHQRAENEARNTQMYRGQETHPIRANARYEINYCQ